MFTPSRTPSPTCRSIRPGLLSRAALFLLVASVAFLPGSSRAQITVRGQLAHDLDVVPGQVVTGVILVDNETDAVQQARVYLRDYLFHADGTNDYGEPGSAPRSNAAWIAFSPENLTVPPGSSIEVSYSISVPDSVSPGSYWSMMMVESVDPSSAESTTGDADEERQMGFRQVTRYGVQLAVHFRSGAERNVAFDGIQLLADEEGHTWFQADVLNTGLLMMRPDVYMRVFDADGGEYGPFEGVQYRLYPGTSVRQRIDLSGLGPGTYQALLIVDNGDEAVFGGQYELTL